MGSKRVNLRAILADANLRRKMMVSTIQATQAREGIETSPAQADRAYYVVTEGEKAAFFALVPFKGLKRGKLDRRHEMFVRALRGEVEAVRADIALRDFSVIDGSPLAFDRVGLLAKTFRDHEPAERYAQTYQGVITGVDDPYIRCHWEIAPRREARPWQTLHKGGDFSRFYYDSELVLDWSDSAKSEFHRLRDPAIYFKQGLTWPRRTQKGFNLRRLPSGCVFSDKGPAVFFKSLELEDFFLGLGNSLFAEFVMQTLMSFGSWELTVIRRFPLALGTSEQRRKIAELAIVIYAAKADWDLGNEISTRFVEPWPLREDLVGASCSITERLDALFEVEGREEQKIKAAMSAIDEAVFALYKVPAATQSSITQTLPGRPEEVIWPQMEDKTVAQKRMEHVWRLLSYAVKRVIEADDDGIVPFNGATGETPLVERVRRELAVLFPDREESQLEIEIANELKRSAKGYRKCASLDDWLANAYFEYHASLYKSRPIFWHIASAQGTAPFAFGALVHYHRFDKSRMAKLRANYVRDTIEELRRDAGLADKVGRMDERIELQAQLEEVQELDKKLQQIQEGHHEGPEGGERDFRILTPWKEPSARPRGWTPDLDDGVKVNIAPLNRAGVLRVGGIAE
jgi:hypothetical protein